MTPSELEVLIHCHAIAGAHPRFTAPAVQNAIKAFLKMGVIEISGRDELGEFCTTELGKAWVEMILDTPLPICVYSDPRTNNIVGLG